MPLTIEPDAATPTSEPSVPARLPSQDVRVSMTRSIAAWGFGAAYFNLTSGAIYTAFAREIGANNTAFGILAAVLPLMSFLQVIAAWQLERTRRRKRQFLITGLIARSLWLLVPLLALTNYWFPALLPRPFLLPSVIFVITISAICQAFIGPAFFSWMTDLAHSRVRATFFARRVQIGTFSALLVSIAGGLIADSYPHLPVYCAILLLAGVAGILDIAIFFGVREPRFGQYNPAQAREIEAALDELGRNVPSPLASIREPLSDPSVRRFLTFVCLLFCGYGLYGPFLWLHSLEYLGLSKTETGLLVNALPMLAIALTSPFWGRLTQRYGNRPVMRLGTTGMTLVPIGMLLIQPDPTLFAKVMLGFLFFASGILFVAVDLANVNLVTALAPEVPRSTMTALYSIAAGCSFAICSVIAGRLSDALNNWQWSIGDLQFVNFHVLFALSLGVRLVNTVLVVPRLQEPDARSMRFMTREVVPQIYNNFLGRLPQLLTRDND